MPYCAPTVKKKKAITAPPPKPHVKIKKHANGAPSVKKKKNEN